MSKYGSEIGIKDKTPFYITSFPIKEEEKIIVDREMKTGCLPGILRKGLSSYSSPIMLIPRKCQVSHTLLQILDILTQDFQD